MSYSDHTFEKIKFENPNDDTPTLTLKYTAHDDEEDTYKEATDKFPHDLPPPHFLDRWNALVDHWKVHVENLIGDVDWDLNDAKVTTLRLYRDVGELEAVRYWVTVRTVDNEAVTIATPKRPPLDGERKAVDHVCEAAADFLKGARGQPDLFDAADEGDSVPDPDKTEVSS